MHQNLAVILQQLHYGIIELAPVEVVVFDSCHRNFMHKIVFVLITGKPAYLTCIFV